MAASVPSIALCVQLANFILRAIQGVGDAVRDERAGARRVIHLAPSQRGAIHDGLSRRGRQLVRPEKKLFIRIRCLTFLVQRRVRAVSVRIWRLDEWSQMPPNAKHGMPH